MFTLTYEGESGDDVLAAALVQLVNHPGASMFPWVAEVTYLDEADNEVTEMRGIVRVEPGVTPTDPATLVTVSYNERSYEFGKTERTHAMPYVTKVRVV